MGEVNLPLDARKMRGYRHGVNRRETMNDIPMRLVGWISGPMTGHWLDDDRKAAVAEFVETC